MPPRAQEAKEQSLAGLRQRLADVEAGDVDAVASAAAASDHVALLRTTLDFPGDIDILLTAGWFSWYRAMITEAETELLGAYSLFSPVFRVAPDSVPGQVRDWFDGDPSRADGVLTALETDTSELLRSAKSCADLDRLDEALRYGWVATAAMPSGRRGRASRLSELGELLRLRFGHSGAAADLSSAIEVGRAAVAATSADDLDLPGHLCTLLTALMLRVIEDEAPADVDEAIAVGRATVAAVAPDDARLPWYRSNLGFALQRRSQRSRSAADIDEAVVLCQMALDAVPVDAQNRDWYLVSLGEALQLRFMRNGAAADLDRRIDVNQALIDTIPDSHPTWVHQVSNLGLLLFGRAMSTGSTGDLDRAVSLARAAVAATPIDAPDRTRHLLELAFVLHGRSGRTDDARDLDEAIELGEEAVDATYASGSTPPPWALSNIAIALRTRAERNNSLTDLERSVQLGEAAVSSSTADDPDPALYLSSLSRSLQARYLHNRDERDLTRAVDISRSAVRAVAADDPVRCSALRDLGLALILQSGRHHGAGHLDEAIDAFRQAAEVSSATTSTRAGSAATWARLAASKQDWVAAAAGYSMSVGLRARTGRFDLSRSDQERWLASSTDIGAEAAACCLQTGHVDRAVEIWEQGRGVLLGNALAMRTDLRELFRHHPALAAEFVELRDELDRPLPESPGPAADVFGSGSADLTNETTRRKGQAARFDQLISRIRGEERFERFMSPPLVSELVEAAADGPVVLLNVASLRCDALIITRDGVESVPLATISPELVADNVSRFLTMVDLAQNGDDPDQRERAEATLSTILEWLWSDIAEPVLQRLNLTDPLPTMHHINHRRMWWCPGGLLALLPIHAAGLHSTRFDQSPATVMDRVVSSYTPTVRALLHARRTVRAESDTLSPTDRVLVVSMPHTPEASDLPGTVDEAAMVCRQFPGRVDLLHGLVSADEAARLGLPTEVPRTAEADFEHVRTLLPASRWSHFACHAASDLANPSAGLLVLQDHQRRPLTVLEISQLRLDRSEFAYLSACGTARAGERLADEAIHLATAFQLAGCRHVIGTLWPILDRTAVRIATHVYDTLSTSGTRATAHALHEAVRRRRNSDSRRPSNWAAHIHNGV
jgi:tetratricopeptide (TPR) repeat protein